MDKAIIKCILSFLIDNQRNKIDRGLHEAIRWLDHFLTFFIEDLHQEKQDLEQRKKKKARVAAMRRRADSEPEETKETTNETEEQADDNPLKKHIKELSTEVYP